MFCTRSEIMLPIPAGQLAWERPLDADRQMPARCPIFVELSSYRRQMLCVAASLRSPFSFSLKILPHPSDRGMGIPYHH